MVSARLSCQPIRRFSGATIIKLFGHIGGDEAELAFDDLHVEPWQVVGELHQALRLRCTAFPGTHLQLGTLRRLRTVGVEQALDYANTREAFGDSQLPGRVLSIGRMRYRVTRRTFDGG